MKFKDDLYTEFCCSKMEYHTKHPFKSITFVPVTDDIPAQACIFTLPSGRAQIGGKTKDAGRSLVEISYCPWCSAPITFE